MHFMKEEKLYIDLMKKVLTDFHRIEFDEHKYLDTILEPSIKARFLMLLDNFLRKKDFAIVKRISSNEENRRNGRDWPSRADTMIGLKRLDNLEYCIREVITSGIEGDFIETGVWRGGATIFMRAMLKSLNVTDRIVWVADSFEGLPRPEHEVDRNDTHFKINELAISLDVVKHNFEKYDLFDDQVKFLKGWFKETLPVAPIKSLSILRLDGDMYQSTMDALQNLYPKLSKGGYIIIDDWTAVRGCKLAVENYREQHGISEQIMTIDWSGVYWKKEK